MDIFSLNVERRCSGEAEQDGVVATLRPWGRRVNERTVASMCARLRNVLESLGGSLGDSGDAFANSTNDKYVSLLIACIVVEKFGAASRVRNVVSFGCSFVCERVVHGISCGHITI